MGQMHVRRSLMLAVIVATSWLPMTATADVTSPQQIIAEGDKVAQAQLAANGDQAPMDWTWGVMDVGYADFSHVSSRGPAYVQSLAAMFGKTRWTPLFHERAPFHADDFCVGQAILDLDVEQPDAAHLAPLKQRLDALVDHLNATRNQAKLTWYWCDALFMCPPVLARMSTITKDPKYIDAMDQEFWRTTAALYDRDEHLFFRDGRFVHKPDANGKKVFWSRGNGWVMGGLAHVLQLMPAGYPDRSRYETLFKEMAARLITLQGEDGAWRSNLLDPKQFYGPETSGTSLFTFAMAWGINNKLLDREKYLPAVARGWAAMMAARRADGLPGFSQPAGAAPAPAKARGSQVYTTGGYLLAATQVQKLAPLDIPTVVLKTDAAAYVDDPTTQSAGSRLPR